MTPRVSVVIPTYDRAHLVSEAVDSVLAQTVPVHEIIVVDDGSRDATQEVVQRYGRLVTLLRQDNAGVAAARNRGISHASGDWIALLDSDDRWQPKRIEAQLEYLREHPECDLVHTSYSHFGKESRRISSWPPFLAGDYRTEYFLLSTGYWICTSSVLFRNGMGSTFPEWARWSEDVIFFADLHSRGRRFGHVDEPLVDHRVHEITLTQEGRAGSGGARAELRWVRERFASDPVQLSRLQAVMFQEVLRRLRKAKQRRYWGLYWEWREWLVDNWPPGETVPAVLGERIYPPFVYAVKDALCGVARAGRHT